jgi:tetratricopeptide (TPR) repeat protein
VDEAGRPREAVAALRRAVELQPLMLEARVKLADALYRAGDPAAVLSELEAVVTADSVAWPRAWYNLGIIHLERGRHDAARAAFAEASRLDPDLVDAHVQLGTLLLAGGRLDDAEAAFGRATAAAPTNVNALGSVAVLHLARGDTAAARDQLRRVLELDPGNGPALALLRQIGR